MIGTDHSHLQTQLTLQYIREANMTKEGFQLNKPSTILERHITGLVYKCFFDRLPKK